MDVSTSARVSTPTASAQAVAATDKPLSWASGTHGSPVIILPTDAPISELAAISANSRSTSAEEIQLEIPNLKGRLLTIVVAPIATDFQLLIRPWLAIKNAAKVASSDWGDRDQRWNHQTE